MHSQIAVYVLMGAACSTASYQCRCESADDCRICSWHVVMPNMLNPDGISACKLMQSRAAISAGCTCSLALALSTEVVARSAESGLTAMQG